MWINIGPYTAGTVNPATPLELTKSFVTALNSNAMALGAADLSLQTELQAVVNDLQLRTDPVADSSIQALDIAMKGAQLYHDVIQTPSAPFIQSRNFYDTNNYFVPAAVPGGTFNYYGPSIGGCGFYSDANYNVPATSKTDALYVACGSSAQYDDLIRPTNADGTQKQCTTVGEACGARWSYRVRLHPDAVDANKFVVYTMTRQARLTVKTLGYSYSNPLTGQWVSNAATCPTNTSCYATPIAYNEARTHYGAVFPGNAATLSGQTDANGKLTAVNLSGELSPAYNISYNGYTVFNPTLQFSMWVPNQVATVLGDKHDVALSAVLTQNLGMDKLALSGSINLIKGGTLETQIALLQGSYLQQASAPTTGVYDNRDGSQEMLLKISAGSSTSTLNGDLKIGAFMMDASGTDYSPTLMSFTGNVQRNGVSFFDGSISAEMVDRNLFNALAPISDANPMYSYVGIVGNVIIPNRPTLALTLAGNRSDIGFFALTSLSGQYVQGVLTINFSGTQSPFSNVLTLQSTDGIKMVIDQAQTVYPLTKGGTLMGEFSPLTNLLTYTDGSYAQF